MSLGFSPASPVPASTPGNFPLFLLFRALGTDLGGADVTTVDLQAGLTATRGTGDNAGVVTIKTLQPIGVAKPAASTYTVQPTDAELVVNFAGTCTLTLPDATQSAGRRIGVRTITANLVVSASANVTARTDATAATPILPAVDGAWCELVSDGAVWQNMRGS